MRHGVRMVVVGWTLGDHSAFQSSHLDECANERDCLLMWIDVGLSFFVSTFIHLSLSVTREGQAISSHQDCLPAPLPLTTACALSHASVAPSQGCSPWMRRSRHKMMRSSMPTLPSRERLPVASRRRPNSFRTFTTTRLELVTTCFVRQSLFTSSQSKCNERKLS